jgi:methyl coenzyme M reductase beta subunit|tara:strand:- start:10583 stop:10810 length:228 start_codon:yes stop_codon:yes gene_type:complete
MSEVDKKEFANVDKAVFLLASAIDAQLRVQSLVFAFQDLEADYLRNWLQKEKDPVLGTVIAQLLGLREPEATDAG